MILKVSEVNGRSNKIVLGVLVVLLVLGAIYWVNVLDKEQYLIKRNFRLLNLWSHEISNKIDSLNTVSQLAFMELENEQNISLQKYSCHQSNSDSEVPEYVLKRLCAAGLNGIDIKKGEKDENQPGLKIYRDTDDKKLLFNIKSWHASSKFGSDWILTADLDLSEFIAELTNEHIFENVLLISNDHKILFQKVSKEYSWQNWKKIEYHIQEDTWFDFFKDDTSEGGKKPNKDTLDLAPHFFNFKSPHGEQFTIFTQPVHLPGENEVGEETYYIAGIVSGTQFRQSYLSISSKALYITTAVLLSLVVSLPFIRLRMMGSTDSLKSFHICILLFSMSLGSGLLTILFLDIGFSETGKLIIGEQMETSAKKIANQTKAELNDVLDTLAYADMNVNELKGIKKPSDNNSMWTRDSMICDVHTDRKDRNCYPDYSLIYWMDSQGKLRENWTANGFPGYETPLSLIKRAYVSNVLEERQNLWRIKHPREYHFFLDPIISWSTGINRVVASMHSKRSNNSSKAAEYSIQVAALQFEFLSLMKDVVVPPGIGFMVVDDEDSRVLFHSSQQRALRTNFLVETDNNQALRNLVWAGESGFVEGRYWGSDTHFFVLPFDDLPWTLIVYRDREILSSASLVAMVMACTLFTIWTLFLYGIPWFIGWVLRGRFYLKKSWLWPNQKHHSSYRAISIINCILFLSGLCVFWVLSNVPEWLLSACLVILFVGLITSFIIFSGNKNNVSLNATVAGKASFFTILSYPYSFSTMVSTYLLIFSVLPAVAIVGAVYQKEMTTTVKHELLKLNQALNDKAKPMVAFAGTSSDRLKASGITPVEFDQTQKCLESSGPHTGQQYGLLGFYPDFLFDSTWKINCSVADDKNTTKTLFDRFYQAVSYYFLPLKEGGESWGLITNGPNEDQVNWSAENSRVILNGNLRTRFVDLYQPKYPLATEQINWHDLTITASANLPIQSLIFGGKWFERQNPYTYLLYSVLMCIWVSFIYKMPQITANNTLFLFRPRRKNAEFPLDLKILLLDTTPNLIVVGYPGQGKAQQLKQLTKDVKEYVTYLNIRDVPVQNWIGFVDSSKLVCADNNQKSIIIIDQFDFRCNEPDYNDKKLELLEKIMHLSSAGDDCHVHVISNVYPGVFPLNTEEQEAQDTSHHQRVARSARWHKMWETFGLVYYAMNDKESNHDKHNEWLSGELGDNRPPPLIWNKMSEDFLRPHYQAIWQSATLDEQLALFNLSRDQFIHVKHPGLNSLLCKGLIKFSPDLRLMDPRFESFVRYAGKLDQLDQFAKKHRAGNWSLIKVPLGITFVIFFAFLAITQEEFRSIFPALISILPVFFQGMPDLSQLFKGSDKT